MDQVITYYKSYQDRFLEYTDVLSGYEVLSVAQIKKEWSFYLELTVDPNGWQAVWKISRPTCEELNIAFPTIVLVYVEGVDFPELTANVIILAVQDDIHLPSKHNVPLIQLWPTREQEKTIGLNLESTANSLDMLHFFYINLFMPWDYEDDSDWLSKHLESRLHLFYDMRNGTIPISTAEHLKSLMTEARRLQVRRDQIASQMDDNEELKGDSPTQTPNVANLLKIQVRMLQIRNEVELLENPILRNTLLGTLDHKPKKGNKSPQVWLVFDCGKVDEHITFLNQVKTYVDDKDVTFRPTLASTLEIAETNDTILLSRSRHVFGTTCNFEGGGILRGLHLKTDTVIASLNEYVMLNCSGDTVLENLTIDVESAQCGIVVRTGEVTVKNCKIIGDGKSSTHQGIIVLSGGSLSMIDCDLSGFYTAIVGNSGSTVSLENCEIFDVNIGLKVYDKCIITAKSSGFRHCKNYGVCFETDKTLDNCSVNEAGGFSVLEAISNITIEDVTGENNGKGDAIISKKSKLEPIQDLFSNPDLDPTIIHDDSTDEEMDVNVSSETVSDHNNTIIEVNSTSNKDSENVL